MAKSSYKQSKRGSTGLSYRIYEDVLAIAGTLLRNQKDSGAEKLQSLAEATRDFGKSMTDLPNLRSHITTASDSIDDLSSYVMNTEIETMANDAIVFARRHPATVLTAAVGAGLALTFLLRPTHPEAAARNTVARGAAKSRPKKSLTVKKTPVKTKRAVNGSNHVNA